MRCKRRAAASIILDNDTVCCISLDFAYIIYMNQYTLFLEQPVVMIKFKTIYVLLFENTLLQKWYTTKYFNLMF